LRKEELESSVKGKQAELRVFGELLSRGFHVYVPMVDIKGIDCLVDVGKGVYKEIQVKYRAASPAFQVKKLTARDNFYIACCFGVEDLWIIPSKIFRKVGKTAKDREIVRLNVGREGSISYKKLHVYFWNFSQLTEGASKEVKQAVEKASRINRPHLIQIDYALAVLDNLSIIARPLSVEEITKVVLFSLSLRFSDADREVLKGGRKRWETTLSYAIYDLKKKLLIKDDGNSRFVITEKGRACLFNSWQLKVGSWHIVPGHPAGPFGYAGTSAIKESWDKKLPPFDKLSPSFNWTLPFTGLPRKPNHSEEKKDA
jgi:hypothetical protein